MKKPLFFLFSTLLFICFVMTMRFAMNEVSVNNYLNGKYDNDIQSLNKLINISVFVTFHFDILVIYDKEMN